MRHFKYQPVSAEIVTRLLETATHAPSAHNRQPWRFAVLSEPQAKSRLSAAMATEFRRDLATDGLPNSEIEIAVQRSQSRISQAPLVIVLCMDMSEMDVYPDQRRQQAERTMALQSTALAGLLLQLAAHAEGLGSVWVCAPLFAPQAVCKSLALPSTWEPQGMFFLGYTDRTPKPKSLKSVNEVTRFVF